MTFDPAAGRKTYVTAWCRRRRTRPTTLGWTNDQTFVIGNEVTQRSPLARHVRDRRDPQQGAVGRRGTAEFRGRRRPVRDAAVRRLEHPRRRRAASTCSRRAVDDASYVFAKPTFVGSPTGVRVKNIRIAVNDTVPVAAQAFRRIDTTALASGTELSRARRRDSRRARTRHGSVPPRVRGARHALRPGGGRRAVVAADAAPRTCPSPRSAVRSFSRVNDTMAALDGRPARQRRGRDVVHGDARHAARNDALARVRLGATSRDPAARGRLLRQRSRPCATACNNFFATTNCAIAAGTQNTIADRVYDNLFGTNLANQPDRSGRSTELVDVMNDLGCTAGCTAATAQTALQATCAAALSSAAVTIN